MVKNQVLCTIPVSEDTANTLEILHTRRLSMENLFHAMMADRYDFFKEEKLQDFLDEYALACLEFDHRLQAAVNPVVLSQYPEAEPYLDKLMPEFSYRMQQIQVFICGPLLARLRKGDASADSNRQE